MRLRTVFDNKVSANSSGQFEQEAIASDEGKHESIKELVKEEEKSKKKLDDLLNKSHACLYRISTVFPFDLFPSTIVVDENNVDVIDRIFFASDVRTSVPVRDIKSVSIESNLFFSTLHVVIDMPSDVTIKIGPLKKSEAFRMKRVIQGLCICVREKIDVSTIEDKGLLKKVEELGGTRET